MLKLSLSGIIRYYPKLSEIILRSVFVAKARFELKECS